ncbi:MAG: hypothetical protein ABII88_11650 [Candidatus Omnitrophota bacterium]
MHQEAKKPARGRPKKHIKYTKTINVRFTHEQWLNIQVLAHRCHLEPSVFIRKTILEHLYGNVGECENTPKETPKPLKALTEGHSLTQAKKALKGLKNTPKQQGHKQLQFIM